MALTQASIQLSLRDLQGLNERQRRGNFQMIDFKQKRLPRCARNDDSFDFARNDDGFGFGRNDDGFGLIKCQ